MPNRTPARRSQPLLADRGADGKPAASRKNGSANSRKPAARPTHITVRGARQHNLKDIDVEIPRDQMTVCCGPSGSGKSSLAMDTIYAEGQRRYVESLSSYARQFVGQMQKPQVEHIDGLSPAIAIEQKHMGHTPRSTVGTVTEIYDYLRILLARLGTAALPGLRHSDRHADGRRDRRQDPGRAGRHEAVPDGAARSRGRRAVRNAVGRAPRGRATSACAIDGETHSLDEPPTIDRRRKHLVEVVIDRVVVRPDARSRIADSVENALGAGQGRAARRLSPTTTCPSRRWRVDVHSQHFACDKCGRSFEPLTPHSFSFNSSLGWCPACEGLGTQTGANPAALLRDPKLTLAEGALSACGPMLAAADVRRRCSRRSGRAHGRAARRAVRATRSPRQRRIVLARHGRGVDRRPAASRKAKAQGSDAARCSASSTKGCIRRSKKRRSCRRGLRSKLEHLVDEVECSTCGGSRLRDDAAAVRFRGRTIDELCRTAAGRAAGTSSTTWKLDGQRAERSPASCCARFDNRLQFLVDVGLEYLTLGRPAPTLSGGEAQRIRLASQVGSGLCGVLYVLDEPTIGLHPRDNARLLGRCKSSATWATRCWSSSTIAK